MDVIPLDVSQLGNRTYLVHDGKVALVVDPPRDIEQVERAAEAAEVEIVAVADTHVHNDYLSGALLLARRHRADYLLSADEAVAFDRAGVRDGDVVALGELSLTAVATPGHTPHHQAFLVTARDVRDGEVGAVFTGGSLLHGAVGRTDLVDPAAAADFARDQWRSARRLAELDPGFTLHPTHGFGSFCAASTAAVPDGVPTIGDARRSHPALTTPQEPFVEGLVERLGPVPAYYERMAPLNRAGAGARPVPDWVETTGADLSVAVVNGGWLIDTRSRQAYAEGHVPGAVSIENGGQLATYVGWLAPQDKDLVLIAEDRSALDGIVRDLATIGVEGLRGHVLPPDAALPRPLGYRRADWAEVAARPTLPVLVDVRQADEYDESHVPGAVHVPVQDVERRAFELPAGELWVHCRSGYRAAIAASLLHRAGRNVVHVDDDWDRALELGLHRPSAA